MGLGNEFCARCEGQKEPHRVGKYSYCLKCQYKISGESYRRRPYAILTDEQKKPYRCRAAVQSALKSGKLEKQPCETCGEAKSEAHHEDYNKPLDVKWLCRKHHFEIHGHKPKTRSRPPARSIRVNAAHIFKTGQSIILSKLQEKLDLEQSRLSLWEKDHSEVLGITRQRQKRRHFAKHIEGLRNAIKAVSSLTFHVKH